MNPSCSFQVLSIIRDKNQCSGTGSRLRELMKQKNTRFDFHIRKQVIITLNVGKCKTGVKIHSPELCTFGAYKFPCCQLQGGDEFYNFACLGVLRNDNISSFFNIAYGRHKP